MKYFSLCVLLLLPRAHCVYSQKYNPVDPVLYEALREAIFEDEGNLLRLKSHFYSLNSAKKQVIFSIYSSQFIVKRINQTENSNPALINCTYSISNEYYCLSESILVGLYSEDHNGLQVYLTKAANLLATIERVSILLYDVLTKKIFELESTVDLCLSVTIDELGRMPSNSDLSDALAAVLSWVCAT